MENGYLFLILLSITVGTFGLMLAQLVFELMDAKKRRIQDRLVAARGEDFASLYGSLSLTNQKRDSLAQLFSRWAFVHSFEKKLRQTYPNIVLTKFLFIVGCVAMGVFVMVALMMKSPVLALGTAGAATVLPFMMVRSKCAKRQRLLDDQLPEALEFLSRVLRAGHSLMTGLQMASEELPEPLASELRRCYDQHSLGQALDEALRETAGRVGTSDFAFFVTAVLIQRQTGGDLSEVLLNISNMIRARIRLQQHVRAITAEGRMVGYILLALPFIFFAILYILNKKYAEVLLITQEGTYLMITAFIMQLLGLLSIKKIVNIKM